MHNCSFLDNKIEKGLEDLSFAQIKNEYLWYTIVLLNQLNLLPALNRCIKAKYLQVSQCSLGIPRPNVSTQNKLS